MSSTVIGNGKVAIITGASAGIGKASAVALLKAGYSVVSPVAVRPS